MMRRRRERCGRARRFATHLDQASRDLDAARGASAPRIRDTPSSRIRCRCALDEIQTRLLDEHVSTCSNTGSANREAIFGSSRRDGLRAFTLPRARCDRECRARIAREDPRARAQQRRISRSERRAEADAAEARKPGGVPHALARQILPDAARHLRASNVVVVADGELQSVPFSLFDFRACRCDGYTRHDDLPAFDRHAARPARACPLRPRRAIRWRSSPIRYSARTTSALQRPRRRSFGESRSAAAERRERSRHRHAATSAHTRDRSAAIAALVHRTAPLGPRSISPRTGHAALRRTWSDYSIAHFATHALLNARHPEFPASCCRCRCRRPPRTASCASTTSTTCACRQISSCSASATRRSARVSAPRARRISRARFSMLDRGVSSRASGRSTIAPASEFMRAFYRRACSTRLQRPQDALVVAQDADAAQSALERRPTTGADT